MKFEWPFVLKSKLDAERKAHQSARAELKAADERFEKQKQEYQSKWMPFLRKMTKIEASSNERLDRFTLHVGLDRNMMEAASILNERVYWEHFAKVTAVHVERELATMNFAGIARMALDYQSRNYRPSLPPLNWGNM